VKLNEYDEQYLIRKRSKLNIYKKLIYLIF
jgi:hypothetical protein